jgi:hypothetical protein
MTSEATSITDRPATSEYFSRCPGARRGLRRFTVSASSGHGAFDFGDALRGELEFAGTHHAFGTREPKAP